MLLASLIQCQPPEALQVLGEGRTEENTLERNYSHVKSPKSRETREGPLRLMEEERGGGRETTADATLPFQVE